MHINSLVYKNQYVVRHSESAHRLPVDMELELRHRIAYLPTDNNEILRIHYVECIPQHACIANVLLIHGFPETSYQYRHVMRPLAVAGYRVIAPDYRGGGDSSHLKCDYDKVTMATDLYRLMREHLGIHDPIHVVGHDIGGMIAHAFATTYPSYTKSVAWGEACIPGSAFYDSAKASIDKFHFMFHRVPDGLPEALVAGRERLYLKQFFDRQINNTEGVRRDDFEHYVYYYSLPDAMRCAFEVYRAFPEDEERNLKVVKEQGKSKVPCLQLNGSLGDHLQYARELGDQFYEFFACAEVAESAHYIAEENPAGFCAALLAFWQGLQE